MSKFYPQEERKWLEKAAEGDQEAFSRLFYAYKDKLYAFVYHIVSSKAMAEDIVQEVFIKIWTNRDHLTEIRTFDSYLFRAAKNHAINQLKAFSRRTKLREKKEVLNNVLSPEEQLLVNNLRIRITQLVGRLPKRQQEVYRLRREQEMKIEEIAYYLNLSPSTVKNHLTQALKNLKKELRTFYPDAIFLMLVLLLSGV